MMVIDLFGDIRDDRSRCSKTNVDKVDILEERRVEYKSGDVRGGGEENRMGETEGQETE